jgi:sulfonate transport system permease protein
VKKLRKHWVALATWIVIIGGWEIASHIVAPGQLKGSPRVPPLEFIWTTTLKGLSGSWTLHMWAPNPAEGGRQTYLGAFLAIGYHSLSTLKRVVLGLLVGGIVGVVSGLAVSYSRILRSTVWGPLNFLRMVPLLAAIPLFQFWFGANTKGTTTFIGFGVWVVLVVATITAVGNVPNEYAESARTLGASRLQTYIYVIVPRALPELRTALLLAAGLSWSLAVGSEYIGLRTGLGTIMANAEATANTGRMVIVALFVITYALLTFGILNRVFTRMVHWMPRRDVTAPMGGAVAAVGGARAVEGA